MNLLLLGLALFFAIHSISIVGESSRDRIVAKIGDLAWKGLYAVVSIVGFTLIVKGYALTRQDPVLLYSAPTWLRHGSMLLLVPVFPILLTAYLPGRIQSAVGHPTLVATEIWAVAHLLANGMLADLLLFGSFLIWAVADHWSMGRRTPRAIPSAPPSAANDIIAIVVGLAIFLGFGGWLHALLIGVPVL